MVDFTKASVESRKPVDKTVYTLTGQFTYTFASGDFGGNYTIPSPEPGTIFLPDSVFSIDDGVTWFSDLDRTLDFIGNLPDLPDINTVVTATNVIYRWGQYGPSGPYTVIYRTRLLAVS